MDSVFLRDFLRSCKHIFALSLCVHADWTHPSAVSGQTHPETQEAVPVCCPGPLRRRQHQPNVGERLSERQSPQSRCRSAGPSLLSIQPGVPQPLSRHPKLQRYHCVQQRSATRPLLQTGRSEGDCQRHELRGQQRRGEGGRQKRPASHDLTRAHTAARRTLFELLPCFFVQSKDSSGLRPSGNAGGRFVLSSSRTDWNVQPNRHLYVCACACVFMCVRLEQCTHTNCTVCIKCEHVCVHMYKLIFYTRYCNRFVLYTQWVCFISISIDLASVKLETKCWKALQCGSLLKLDVKTRKRNSCFKQSDVSITAV